MIGDDGIAYACSWSTPIMDLARSWVGIEKLVYDLAEHPDVVEHAFEIIADHYCRQYEIIAANSPCEVIVFWDDANSLYLSRDMFERYSVPVLRRFSEIAHRHGKILVNHTCGKIDAFLNLYAQTAADAIDWLTPPPTGDTEPKRAQKVFGRKTAIMLAVIPEIMRNGSPDDVEKHLRSLLSDVDALNNFILMIPPPVSTPIENAKRIVEILVKEYDMPLNRSAKFGGILDV
jgi:uroporphyrinogen-III decarboxylase